MAKIKCRGCGAELEINYKDITKCAYCNSIISEMPPLEPTFLERLNLARGYRRVGRFDDAQQELESLLEFYNESALSQKGDFLEAEFEYVLNYYEVMQFSFEKDDSVKSCICYSTDRRPVDKNKDWLEIKKKLNGACKEQWTALCERIEKLRIRNLKIRNGIPRYRAILLFDYSCSTDKQAADQLYCVLSKKTDIFYPPISLGKIPLEDKGNYLKQVLVNPELAPLMFVVYSDAYNFRKKTNNYYYNIARQCEDFAKVHTKYEMISVTCDFEPPAMIKRLSIKTITWDKFDEDSYQELADLILAKIADATYSDSEYDAYEKNEAVMLNNVLSPFVFPVD